MATILFEGSEFDIGPELTVGNVLGAACMRYGDPADWSRFKLFDEHGREVQPSELVGRRRLALCDVRKLAASRTGNEAHENRLIASGK